LRERHFAKAPHTDFCNEASGLKSPDGLNAGINDGAVVGQSIDLQSQAIGMGNHVFDDGKCVGVDANVGLHRILRMFDQTGYEKEGVCMAVSIKVFKWPIRRMSSLRARRGDEASASTVQNGVPAITEEPTEGRSWAQLGQTWAVDATMCRVARTT
jgi:hypothetical protein